MFNLPAIIDLAADNDTVSATLSPESVALISLAFGLLIDQNNWTGAGDELTDAERDQIDAMVSALMWEITP